MNTSTEHAHLNSGEYGEPRRATNVVAHPINSREGLPLATAVRARGGLSLWSAVSGVLVAFGALVLLGALTGAVLAATGMVEGNLTTDEVRRAGIGGVLALLVVQFLAYVWGGYTAGRMARGSGWLNGALVALGGTVILSIVGGVFMAVAGPASVNTFDALAIPVENLGEAVTASGIALLLVMVSGACLGGRLGARWHTKLENEHLPAALW